MRFAFFIALAFGTLLNSISNAQIFDESSLGDFSNVSSSPTAIGQLLTGTNTISGTTGSNDRDIVTFSIGASDQLTSFVITDFTEAGGHFFGFASGPTAPDSGSGFLISDLISSNETPFQVLGASGGQFGGSGVPLVLGPGDYTVFFNETSGVSPNYSAELTITTVPEPGSLAFLVSTIGLAIVRRKR